MPPMNGDDIAQMVAGIANMMNRKPFISDAMINYLCFKAYHKRH